MKKLTKNDNLLIEKLKGLPLDFWDFREEDTREYTHGLHNYPATMVCPISRNIIKIVKEIRPIHSLFDPFAGSGTVLVEGMLAGINTIAGNDINPLATLLEKVKTTPIYKNLITASVFEGLLKSIRSRRAKLETALCKIDAYMEATLGLDLTAKTGWGDNAPMYLKQFCDEYKLNISLPDFKNLGYWFRPRVILELAIIKDAIEKIDDEAIRNFAFVALSDCIRLVSNRRNGEFKMFRIPPEKVRLFNPAVFEEFQRILSRNLEKMQSFCDELAKLPSLPSVSIFRNNACTLEDVPNNTYDLIITSPPYGDSRTTVAYGEFSRLSLQWINLFQLDERAILGVDRSLMGGKKFRNGFECNVDSPTLQESLDKIKNIDLPRAGDVYSFYVDLNDTLKSIAQKTTRGGYQFWVVGNRTVKGEVLKTDQIIAELAPKYNLTPVYDVNRNIPNKVMPAQNSPSNIAGETASTITMEHIVILRKN